MKKYILLSMMLFAQGCSAQNSTHSQGRGVRIEHGVSSILGVLIQQGANVAAGGSFDSQAVQQGVAYTVGSEMNSEVYDHYYDSVAESAEAHAHDRAYQIWARQKDIQRGQNTLEDSYKKRYDDEVRNGRR